MSNFSTKEQSIATRSGFAPGLLPKAFLSGPAPDPASVHRFAVDWAGQGLPEYTGRYAVVIDGLFSRRECDMLVQAAVQTNKLSKQQAQAERNKDKKKRKKTTKKSRKDEEFDDDDNDNDDNDDDDDDDDDDGWDRAMINTGRYTQELATDIRNGGRVIVDDVAVAAQLWARIAPHVPELAARPLANEPLVLGGSRTSRGDVWAFAGLNERLRFLQYGPGEYFREHCDGPFVRPDASAMSFYTLHLYLNEAEPGNDLKGGATSFHSMKEYFKNGCEIVESLDVNVEPKIGRILIFQHDGLLHSGQEVDRGLKLTMRTDLMFRRLEQMVPKDQRSLSNEGRRFSVSQGRYVDLEDTGESAAKRRKIFE